MKNDSIKLFHYTTLGKFLEHIVPQKSLRLNSLKNSRDPYEFKLPQFQYSFFQKEIEEYQHKGLDERVVELRDYWENSQILSFVTQDIHISCNGYDLPRMWEQYGDRHKGICLEFDYYQLKEDFLYGISNHQKELLDSSFFEPVKYVPQKSFDIFWSINKENFSNFMNDSYIRNDFKNLLMQKDSDYKSENEYRVLLLTKSNVSEVYIDITKSLTGIYWGNAIQEITMRCYYEFLYKQFESCKQYYTFWSNGCCSPILLNWYHKGEA